MPIIVKDYKFFQTSNTTTIHIPLHGIPKSKIDLLTAENYIKASFEQFFFEVFLFQPIDVDKSKCTVNDNDIILELFKQEEGLWEKMEKNLEKDEKKEVRRKAFIEVQERVKKEHEDKLIKKDQLKKCAVSEAIRIDTKQRNTIEEIKKVEKEKALGDINEWNERLNKKTIKSSKKNIISQYDKTSKSEKTDEDKYPDNINSEMNTTSKSNSNGNENIKNQKDFNSTKSKLLKSNFSSTRTIYYKNHKNNPTGQEKSISIPLPRNNAIISVNFTKRVLPTPSRESKKVEEDEWLEKQAAARRSAGFASEDLRPEEKNPQCLLAKGDKFLKDGNLLGAISAYSFGIQISPKFVDLYIKRSEAQYLLGNYHKTVNDCSSALDMMKPEVSANLEQRAICIGRRGMALDKLGMKKQALDELKASLSLNSGNAEFGKYYYKVLDELNTGKCEVDENDDKDEPGFELFK